MRAVRLSAAAALLGFGLGAVGAAAQSRFALTDPLDVFAVATLAAIQPDSIGLNTEFCGLIGRNEAGELVSTEPLRGVRDGCLPPPDPPGLDVLATWHTHGGWSVEYDGEVPSVIDLRGDIEDGLEGYVATPGGRVWRNRARFGVAVLICGTGCVTPDPAYRPCPAFPPGRKYDLKALERRSKDDPGYC